MPANELAAADLLARLSTSPLAIAPGAGEQLLRMLTRATVNGMSAASAKGKSAPPSPRYVAGIGLYGSLFSRGNLLTELGYGTALDQFAAAVNQAAADPTISSIVLHVDSPGGEVYGTEQAALAVREAAKKKRVTAVVDSVAASGAYWIASNASEITVTPEGEVGSIGVYLMHVDYSRALEAEGVKISFIKAGKYKAMGNPYEPLGDAAASQLQAGVNDYYAMFLQAVARGRNVSPSRVASEFGEGGMVRAQGAVARGMADRIGTFHAEVERLLGTGSARASVNRPAPRASAGADFDIEVRRRRMLMDEPAPAAVNRIASYTEREAAHAIEVRKRRLLMDEPARKVGERRKWHVAHHEAGHAVVAVALGVRVIRASILLDQLDGAKGRGDDGHISHAKCKPEQTAVICSAGRYAGWLSDAEFCDSENGTDDRDAHEALRGNPVALNDCRQRAAALVQKHAAAIRAVAEKLYFAYQLDGEEIESICRAHGL